LSDDSHGPHAVGLNYPRLLKYACTVGIKEMWYLERSQEPNIGGRFVGSRKVAGNWWEDSFWSKANNIS
jgi:histidinol-phosphatase (PHP family)